MKKAKPLQKIEDVPVAERFCRKIKVTESGCWEWQGAKHHQNGYGQFWYRGRAHQAHRISYALFVGGIPEGMTVDHKCVNKICVNPDHLRLMTHEENCRREHDKTDE